MTASTGVGRGHGRHHTGPRAKKPAVPGMSPPVASKPVAKSTGVGRGHGKHHHGPNPNAHHPHKKTVK